MFVNDYENEVQTFWLEGNVYHSIIEYETKSRLEVKPIYIKKTNIRTKYDAGSNLLIKISLRDSGFLEDTTSGKLSVWLDYYRLYELNKFVETYVKHIKSGKVFSNHDGILSLIEPIFEMTHFCDKSKSVHLSPILSENGPHIRIIFKIGNDKGISEGSIVCTLTELVVLSSSLSSLLNQFSVVGETMACNMKMTEVQDMKSNIQALAQMIQKLEFLIIKNNMSYPVGNTTFVQPQQVIQHSQSNEIEKQIKDVEIHVKHESDDSDLLSSFKEFIIENNTTPVQKENDINVQTQTASAVPSLVVNNNKGTETVINKSFVYGSQFEKYMKMYRHSNVGEFTDLLQITAHSSDMFTQTIFTDVIVPMVKDDFNVSSDQNQNYEVLKTIVSCIRGGHTSEQIKEFLGVYSSICYPSFKRVHQIILKDKRIESIDEMNSLCSHIPKFLTETGSYGDMNKDDYARIVCSFMDFLIMDQVFGYLYKKISEKYKYKSIYLVFNRYIIQWCIIPLMWGRCIKDYGYEELLKVFENVWSYWDKNHDKLFSYLYDSDVITQDDGIRTFVKGELDIYFNKFGKNFFINKSLPSICNELNSNNEKQMKRIVSPYLNNPDYTYPENIIEFYCDMFKIDQEHLN